MVVRLCVDHVEDHGLMLEGIYRSSGVKSKVNKLRAAFNSRTCSGINLSDYEPAVVASVLKQVHHNRVTFDQYQESLIWLNGIPDP